jgi:K(+)-stimulated pyrophosphate-energized sodium pump
LFRKYNLWLFFHHYQLLVLWCRVIPEFTKLFTSGKSHMFRKLLKLQKKGVHPEYLAGLWQAISVLFGKHGIFCFDVCRLFCQWIWPEYDHDLSVNLRFLVGGFRFSGDGTCHHCRGQYGPVTLMPRYIYELSLIESIPNIEKKFKLNWFSPDFEKGQIYLEANDGAVILKGHSKTCV